MQDLSLYHIDTGLQQMLDYRAERMADTIEPPDAEEVAALDGEIRKYMEQLPAKVDGVVAILRMFRGRHEAIKAEISRLKGLDAAVQADEERLKGYCAEILERQPLPKKGPRKLIGATSELRLVGNGGLQALTCDPAMVPDEYKDITVRMPMSDWNHIMSDPQRYDPEGLLRNATLIHDEPSNSRIRAALAEDCQRCNGNGVVEGIEGFSEPENPCKECGGSGHAGVLGVRLEPRGAHVEVK